MKAILLAGGYGTRLKPLTNTIPKCLVPINGKPLLEIWLEQLSNNGVDEFLINTHYLSHQVENFVLHSSYRERVTLVFETELLGTAGTLINNLSFWQGEDVLIVHADNLCLCNWKNFFLKHQNLLPYCDLTMMTFVTDTPSSCGIVDLNDSGVVESFYEKSKEDHGNIANGAIYMLGKNFYKHLVNHKPEVDGLYDFSNDVLPHLMGKIQTWMCDGYLVDIGTPETYAQACKTAIFGVS